MGRNKKKSKAADATSEDVDEADVGVVTEDGGISASMAALLLGDQTSDAENELEAPKKKKEYMGGNQKKGAGKKKTDPDAAEAPVGGAATTEPTKAVANDDEAADEKEDEVEVTRQEPVAVMYCAVCTFPAEMCEFSGMYEQCRPWLQEHAAELADAEERGRKRRPLTEMAKMEAMLSQKSGRKAIERIIVLDAHQRQGKKMTTTVRGLQLFGLNQIDLSRDFRKMFSCGCGVTSEPGVPDFIDIQGNFVEQLSELLPKKYGVPKEVIYYMDGKKRVPAHPPGA